MKIEVKVVKWSYHHSAYFLDNILYLEIDKWDDYLFKTTFHAYWGKTSLGEIKITYKGQNENSLTSFHIKKETFPLNGKYCSLGMQMFYEGLMQLETSIKNEILVCLRDCVYNSEIYDEFKSEKAFRASLLRNIDWKYHKQLCNSILNGNAILTPYDIKIEAFKEDDSEPITIKLQSNPDSALPTNIHVLIGRNAVGKTQLLDKIYNPKCKNFYSKVNMDAKEIKKIIYIDLRTTGLTEELRDKIEQLNKLLGIPDPDDPFEMPPIEDTNEYKCYKLFEDLLCNKNKEPNKIEITDTSKIYFKTGLDKCFSRVDWKDRWFEIVKKLYTDPIFKTFDYINHMEDMNYIINNYNIASSGHKHILLILTYIIPLVSERTLVLIDEPETHLHPPLLSSFIRTLSKLLKERNAIAFIATHSPIVLQEVPKSCVSILERDESGLFLRRPERETFAENIGTLTSDVFGYELKNSGFYKLLNDEVESDKSYEKIMEKFGDKLGSEGLSIIAHLINKKSQINK